MTDELAARGERLRTGLNIIHVDDDGLPNDERQSLEVTLLTTEARRVLNLCAGRDDEAARAWREAPQAWLALVDLCQSGDRNPVLGRALQWKRAALPNM